jgi:sirohydrochlorin cobaltochelatase
MLTWIVLAMHGVPPRDLPSQEVAESMRLHMQLERMPADAPARAETEAHFRTLDERIRAWPRSEANDPYHAASLRLAEALGRASGCPVVVGFNEFCAPDIGQALDQTAAGGAERVVVVTPMMTVGGEHAEVELPEQVAAARRRHPGVAFVYAWPYDPEVVALFLAGQVARFAEST